MLPLRKTLTYTLPLLTIAFLGGGLVAWYLAPQSEMLEESTANQKEELGEVFGTSVHPPSRPESLPKEIPLYSPATLIGITETKQVIQIVFETSADEDTLIEFYDRHLRLPAQAGTTQWQKEGQTKYSKGDQHLELQLIPDLLKPLTTVILTYFSE